MTNLGLHTQPTFQHPRHKLALPSLPLHRPDAFEKHAKVCTPDNPGGPLGPPKGGIKPPPGKAPGAAGGAGGGGAGPRAPSARKPMGGGGMGGGGGGSGGMARGGGGGGGGMMSKPRAFTCYLCGQQYGRSSLLIHIPQVIAGAWRAGQGL